MKDNKFKNHLKEKLAAPEFLKEFINQSIEEGDVSSLKVALGEAIRTIGVDEISQKTNIPRQTIYRMLSKDGNPNFSNLTTILAAIGLTLKVETRAAKAG